MFYDILFPDISRTELKIPLFFNSAPKFPFEEHHFLSDKDKLRLEGNGFNPSQTVSIKKR
jgi:hypothetical protein